MKAKIVSEMVELHTDDLSADLLHNLSRIYPLLVVLDHCLNYFLWIGDQLSLNFINTVLFIFALRFLLLDRLIIENFESFLVILFGVWSTYFNIISCLYYLVSVITHIENDEPPTLDQLNYLLNNVSDKLNVIRFQIRSMIGTNSFQWRKIITIVAILTPLHFLLVSQWNILDERGYILLIMLTIIFYNSYWVQGTGLLIWRLVCIRHLYHGFQDQQTDSNTINSLQDYISIRLKENSQSGYTINLDLDSLGMDKNDKTFTFIMRIRTILSELNCNYDSNNKSLPVFVVTENNLSFQYQILEIIVQENERKWYDNIWSKKLLPFERRNTYIKLSNDNYQSCTTKDALVQTIPLEWDWLEDDWITQDWQYCDTNWNKIGLSDTRECFTRTRISQRLIFAKLETNKL